MAGACSRGVEDCYEIGIGKNTGGKKVVENKVEKVCRKEGLLTRGCGATALIMGVDMFDRVRSALMQVKRKEKLQKGE